MVNTTIQIAKETRDRLKSFGKKGDNYDEVLNLIMDELNQQGDNGTGGSAECS